MASFLDITLDHLTDEERIELVNTITPLIRTINAETDQQIHFITDEMKKSQMKLQEALGRKMKSSLTGQMKDDDKTRDEQIDIIEDGIHYNLRKKQVKLHSAAQLLNTLFNDAFGDGVSRNNTIETNQINTFLDSLKAPVAQQAVADINLTLEVKALTESHNSYVSTKAERASIKESDNTPLLAPSRRDLNSDIVFLEKHIEFHHRKGSEVHTELASKLSTPISEIMSVARARATRKENSEAN